MGKAGMMDSTIRFGVRDVLASLAEGGRMIV